jgi:hypothetical protein
MRSPRKPIEDLRTAVQCLPEHTRRAMLDGVRANDIIVGAYTDGRGGVCPMLAAHRRGGRTDLLAFARAWDRFTDAGRRARRATEREVRILVSHLEASLMPAERPGELGRAISEHQALRDGGTRRPRPGDRDRSRELRDREGWGWLRPFRRYDDYRRAIARVEAQRDESRELELV